MAPTSGLYRASLMVTVPKGDTTAVVGSERHVWPRSRGSPAGGAGQVSPERRTCVKLIRFRSGELAAVALRATECGRPVACYIREAALGAALHARRTPVNDALIRELARLGNELAALGGRARDLQLPIASEFDRALEALLTTVHSIE